MHVCVYFPTSVGLTKIYIHEKMFRVAHKGGLLPLANKLNSTNAINHWVGLDTELTEVLV